MTVLMTKEKADAIASVERDKHLLTDKAAEERIRTTEPISIREQLKKHSESRDYLDFRMKNG